MSLKEGDFIEVEYTGKLKEEDFIFDTTNENIAKKAGVYEKNSKYGPIIVCLGENHLLKGLDKQLKGKEIGKEYDFEISAEEGFGKKSAKLLRLVPKSTFIKHNINAQQGLQVQIDGMTGIIKKITGGRVIVDFNHPLASKDLKYKIKVNKIVKEPEKQIKAILNLKLGIKKSNINVKENKEKKIFEITLNNKFDLPEEFLKKLKTEIEKLIKQKVNFK